MSITRTDNAARYDRLAREARKLEELAENMGRLYRDTGKIPAGDKAAEAVNDRFAVRDEMRRLAAETHEEDRRLCGPFFTEVTPDNGGVTVRKSDGSSVRITDVELDVAIEAGTEASPVYSALRRICDHVRAGR